jgi:hypothetical protein
MSRYPGATWRGPVPNVGGAMSGYRLFVVHVQQGTEAGTDAWFHNPAAQVSAHFGNPKSGSPDQWVDTGQVAWAEANYNSVSVSVENEGKSGESLTVSQLENAARILAWSHTTHGIKLQVTDDPNGEGVIGHGLLGVAGGNHPDCPGQSILNQRQAIVNRAIAILNPAPPPPLPKDDDMILHSITGSPDVWALSGSLYWHVSDPASLNAYKAAGVPQATITAAEHAGILAAVAALSAAPVALDSAAFGAAVGAALVGHLPAAPTKVTFPAVEAVIG